MFLGVDIATSGVKVVIVSEAGTVFAQASAPLAVARPHPLWSEQDANRGDPQNGWDTDQFPNSTLASMAEHAIHSNRGPEPRSGRQEWLENLVNRF